MSIVYRSDHRFLPFIPGYCFNFLSLRVLNVYVHCAALFDVVEERKVNVKHSKGNARTTRARACHTMTKRDTRRLVASFPCSPSGHRRDVPNASRCTSATAMDDTTPKASTSHLVTPQSQRCGTTNSRKRKRGSESSPPPRMRPPKQETSSSLLLDVPGVLVLPPNHKAYVASCILSLRVVRSYLAEGSKPQDLECRAWTALAEIGFRIIRAGWSTSDLTPWAHKLASEVCFGPRMSFDNL